MIRNNHSFLFVNFFESGSFGGYTNLRYEGNMSGAVLAALDFYYVDNSFLHLRKRVLPLDSGALALGEAGISSGVVFREIDRVVGKLRFTFQDSQLAGIDSDFLENFGRSSKLPTNSLWNSNSRVDNYSSAFMFFSSLEWTKALWCAEYDLKLDEFEILRGVSLYESSSAVLTKRPLFVESFEKAGFSRTQKFKFLGINLPGTVERFNKTEGREFIRLFLANKVILANYEIKNFSKSSSLFETLFYSSFFDVRSIDKFYIKGG